MLWSYSGIGLFSYEEDLKWGKEMRDKNTYIFYSGFTHLVVQVICVYLGKKIYL